MRQETINIYTFEELDDKAKQKAIDHFRNTCDYHWSSEWRDSLNEFEKTFPIKINDWSVGAHDYSHIRFSFTGEHEDMKGIRLFKYIANNYAHILSKDCPFTGYCGDESLLDPIRQFMKRPDKDLSFYDLMKDCLDHWVSEYQGDMESQLEDEYISDFIQANGYEFLENGDMA